MSAPVFFHPAVASATVGDLVELQGAEGRHAVSALRVTVGERIELVDGAGTRAQSVVSSVAGREVCVVRIERLQVDQEPDLRFVVAQALLKGEHDERAVDLMTQVGVDAIIPLQSDRCVVRWDEDRAAKGRARWESAAGAAARQARRARWPEILDPIDPVALGAECAAADLALLLDPGASTAIGDLTLPQRGTILVVVGPEGGFTEAEVSLLRSSGATPTRLGPQVLRGSAAGLAALAALSAVGRWRDPS